METEPYPTVPPDAMIASPRVTTDPEFAHWIAPLTADERRLLEESLLDEGCRDPITTWNGVIVDGHHRYWICSEHGIPFEIRERAFADREAVKEWMLRNQLARRNLTREQWTFNVGALYQMQKREIGRPAGNGQNVGPLRTDEKIAEQFGISRQTVHNAAKFADAVDAIGDEYGDEARTDILTGKAGLSQKAVVSQANVHFSSETEEWYTPPEIIDAVLAVLGEIDLDPCSNTGHPNVPAREHVTKDEDGLAREWHGRIYMNPPYGREVVLWVMKILQEIEAKRTTGAIVLVAARTDTRWFKLLGDACQAWCAVEGRLNFSGSRNPAPFPSAVFYFGENVRDFYLSFEPIGSLWRTLAWEEADAS